MHITEHKIGLPTEIQPEESRRWFERAKNVLAGGISSSARATTTGRFDFPLYMTHGHGSRIWDADDNEYIDYLLGYGSSILGHANGKLVEALKQRLEHGTMFGTCNTVEVQLAEQICRMVPCAELVRYANSGSEAICGAVRGARGYTGRSKVLKFEGHYHGWVDVLAVSNRPGEDEMGPFEAPYSSPHSSGIPQGVVDDVVVAPWNEPEILRDILDRYQGQLAAIIAEPIVANNACIMPRPGYLEFLREQCDRRGIVLIYDEIVTGFRIAPGGAQELFGVKPDLAIYSKALGGGLPISAFAGCRKIMEMFATSEIRHGGTYNSNPLCAASALHTLQTLSRSDIHRRINYAGETVMNAIRKAAADHHVPCLVQGLGSMFQVVFGEGIKTLSNYRDLFPADVRMFSRFSQALLEQGVHINNSGMACWFVSAAHSADDVELTAAAIDRAFKSIAG